MTPQDRATIAQFEKERNEALLSMDEDKIRTVLLKWSGRPIPQGEVFWGAIHKTITGIPSLPLDFRKKSKRWLEERNLTSLDDGDL